jgi:hypothetical protein
MKGYDSEFIANRIKWRAKKHHIPTPSTDFWLQAPQKVRELLPARFDHPVLYSDANDGRVTVIGTEEVAVISETFSSRLYLDDIIAISSPNISEGKQKSLFNELSITTPNGVVILATENGDGCFAVWNILLMLSRLRSR